MSGRNIRRKQVKEAKLKTKKYRNELVKSGVPVKDVDKIIEDNPDIVTDVISYNDVLKAFDQASASAKYTLDILQMVNVDIDKLIEGVDKEEHITLLNGSIKNIKEALNVHLEVLPVYNKHKDKGDVEITLEDSVDLANIASMADLTMSTIEEIQVITFMTLVPAVGLSIDNIGGV